MRVEVKREDRQSLASFMRAMDEVIEDLELNPISFELDD